MSIKLKVVLGVLACLTLSALANARLAAWLRQQDVEAAAQQSLHTAAESYAGLQQADVEKLSAALEALAADAGLAEAFARRDRPRLLELATPLFTALRERHGVTHWYFHEPGPPRCFLRVHAPSLHGDLVERPTMAEAVARQDTASGMELGRTAFALRVVRPWTCGGTLIGYLELGEEVDHFLRRMERQTGDGFAMLVLKERLDEREWAATRGGARNTWDDRKDLVLVDSTADDRRLLGWEGRVQDLPEGGQVLGLERRGDRAFVRGALPLVDATGARVGALLVLHDVTALDRGLEDHHRGVLMVVLGIALVTSVLLVLLLERLVFRRLERMMERMEDLGARVAGGDYDVARDAPPPSGDEIGRLEEFFARFLRVVGGALSELQRRLGRDG